MKICSKCKQEKPETEFYKDICQKDGLSTQCKACKQLYREQHRKQNKQSSENWRKQNPNYSKEYELKRKGTRLEYQREYEKQNKEKRAQQHREWYEQNKEKQFNYRKQYYEQNKDKINKQKQQKRLDNPIYRFNENFSSSLHDALSDNAEFRHWEQYVDYTFNELKEHLEKQFILEMNWDNFGSYWEVDHIIPQNTFNLNNIDEFKICWSLCNLRPLEVIENRRRPKDGRDIPEHTKQQIREGRYFNYAENL